MKNLQNNILKDVRFESSDDNNSKFFHFNFKLNDEVIDVSFNIEHYRFFGDHITGEDTVTKMIAFKLQEEIYKQLSNK